jgi:hypothetical protein
MTDDELDDWVGAMNKRGHASMFARRSSEDKPMVERDTANEWSRSMLGEFDVEIIDIANSASDPPDCVGVHNGRLISIELTELVNERALKKIGRVSKGKEIPTGLFAETQWDAKLLKWEIDKLLDDKATAFLRSACN